MVLRRQHDGGDLGLVAHLGQKKRHGRGAKYAKAGRIAGVGLCDLVRNQHPNCHGDKGAAQHPTQNLRPQPGGNPGSQGTGQRVVGQRGHQNRQHDRPGLAKAGRQNQRQQLRLVAHFSQRDDTG